MTDYELEVLFAVVRLEWQADKTSATPLHIVYARAIEQAARATPADQALPIAYEYQHDEGHITFVDPWQKENGWEEANDRWTLVGPVYRRAFQPPQNAADHIVDANKKVDGDSDRTLAFIDLLNHYDSTMRNLLALPSGRTQEQKDRGRLALIEAFEAQAPQPEAQSVRDAGHAIPSGWRFYSADFSVNAKDQRCPGHVMLIRDPDGKAAWLGLSDEEREIIDLHVQGKGLTFDAALSNACEVALKSAPPQKPVSDEVKP